MNTLDFQKLSANYPTKPSLPEATIQPTVPTTYCHQNHVCGWPWQLETSSNHNQPDPSGHWQAQTCLTFLRSNGHQSDQVWKALLKISEFSSQICVWKMTLLQKTTNYCITSVTSVLKFGRWGYVVAAILSLLIAGGMYIPWRFSRDNQDIWRTTHTGEARAREGPIWKSAMR